MPKSNGLAFQRGRLLDDEYIPGSLMDRESRLGLRHVAPLDEFRKRIAAETGHPLPAFDPDSAGLNAEALFVLRDPSEIAARNGFISIDNNDATARATTSFYDESGLDRNRTLHWNTVPWFVGQRAIEAAARQARPYLADLVGMLTSLRVIVVLGKPARDSWDLLGLDPGVPVLKCPHPNPQAWSRIDPVSGLPGRLAITRAFEQVVEILG